MSDTLDLAAGLGWFIGLSPGEQDELIEQLNEDELATLEHELGNLEPQRANPAVFAAWMTEGQPDEYQLWRHSVCMAESLALAGSGEEPHQILMVGSQYGKTTLLMWFVLWMLDRDPTLRIMYVSHAADRATSFGRSVRDLVRLHHKRLRFSLRTDLRAAGMWQTNKGGGLYCVGVNGQITGFPQDALLCLTGETLVETPSGPRRIDDLAQHGGTVWAYDHDSGQAIARAVTGSRQSLAPVLVEVECTSGVRFRCTPEHPIWIEGSGYVAAGLVEDGAQIRRVGTDALPSMRDVVQAPRGRPCQESAPGRDVDVLLAPVPGSGRPQGGNLPAVRVFHGGEEWAALLPELSGPAQEGKSAVAAEDVPAMHGHFLADDIPEEVLLRAMSEPSALLGDAWERKLALQGGGQLQQRVLQDALAGARARRQGLRSVQSYNRTPAGRPPLRREPREQSPREPRDAVQLVSHHPPQVGYDTVAVVRQVRTNGERVYDLSVEGARNFFAEGVLVHNCDDLFKGWEMAHSPTQREHVWNVYTSQCRFRLQSSANPIVHVGTRWHEDDIPARLLENAANPEADQWHVTRLPTFAEAPNPMARDPLLRIEDPLARVPGELLCPERFDEKEALARKANLAMYLWSAMEQQRPTPIEGSIFKRQWWVLEPVFDPRAVDAWISSWDMKLKNRKAGDFVVGQVWARIGSHYWLVDMFRGQWNQPTVENAVALCMVRWPQITIHVMENTGNGPEVMTSLRTRTPDYELSDDIAGELVMTKPEREAVQNRRRRGLPGILPNTPQGDKLTRAIATTGAIQSGHAHVRSHNTAGTPLPWLPDFLEEMAAFTGHGDAHDDIVDACTQAINYYTGGGGGRIQTATDALLSVRAG